MIVRFISAYECWIFDFVDNLVKRKVVNRETKEETIVLSSIEDIIKKFYCIPTVKTYGILKIDFLERVDDVWKTVNNPL